MNNIAIFASGSGTNAENIISYFSNEKEVTVKLVLTNNPNALVLQRAEKYSVEAYIFDRPMLYSTGEVLKVLEEKSIDFIILAGFLWLVPPDIIKAFDGRIPPIAITMMTTIAICWFLDKRFPPLPTSETSLSRVVH